MPWDRGHSKKALNKNMDTNQPKKLKVGFFSFTCDEGCSIYLIEIFNKKLEEWLKKMEIRYFLSLKGKNELRNLDLAFVEGVIATQKDLENIKKVRKNSKVLIAMGQCAISGLPSGQRNFFNPEQSKEISHILKKFNYLSKCLSIKQAVRVDDEIEGCPINKEKLIEVMEKYLAK